MKTCLASLLVLGLTFCSGLLRAEDIQVGDTTLTVPAPEGCLPLSKDAAYYQMTARFLPATNELKAIFLSETDHKTAAAGGFPSAQRWFNVQVARSLNPHVVTLKDFTLMKDTVKKENTQIVKDAEKRIPGLLDKINKGVAKDYNVDLNLSLNQMVPLPPHLDTDRALAYTALIKFSRNGADEKPTEVEGAITIAFVHVKGKVLFLYANAAKDDIEWSQQASGKWIDAVIAANPSTGALASREKGGGFDWNSVLKNTIIGAVVGGLIGGLASLFRKKKA